MIIILELFDQYRWARKRIGGKWERWIIDNSSYCDRWFQVEEWSEGCRPDPLCRGTPIKEDWTREDEK